MAETSYHGGCHCGAVRFEVDVDLDKTMVCNCSVCTKQGFVWAFAPAARFRLVEGADATTAYRFYKRAIEHRFCATCGVEAFATGSGPDGAGVAAINVRCLDGIDIGALEPSQIDGRSV